MSKIKALWRYLHDGDYRWQVNDVHGLHNSMSDEEFLRKKFLHAMGYPLDLEDPKTFNEKLQWLKLHDRREFYPTMVDKYAAKEYVTDQIGAEYVIPTLGVWDHAEEIDFDALPNRFVLKCTHDSHGLVICRDKNTLDRGAVAARLDECLKKNYYYKFREWPYKNVPPRIIAEQYMEDAAAGGLPDYKFFCFDGVVKCFKIDLDRFTGHRANYYDPEGRLLRLGERICPPDEEREVKLPQNLELMERLSQRLSAGFPFLRVDLYEVDGRVYFGEFTFYPASGFGKFCYEGNDEQLGAWLTLPSDGAGSGVSPRGDE